MRPVGRIADMAVLHWIVMDVVEMPIEIIFVVNHVLPKPRLPNPVLSPFALSYPDLLLASANGDPVRRELLFDPRPPPRVIGIAGWQRPNRMQMLRQQHDRVDLKRPHFFAKAEFFAKKLAGPRVGKQRCSVVGDDGKEEGTAVDAPSPIVGHSRAGFARQRKYK